MESRSNLFAGHTLDGPGVRLEPLAAHHAEGLAEFGLDPRIWRYMTLEVTGVADIQAYVDEAIRWRAEGTALPFATLDSRTGELVGTTRFAGISDHHKRAEIGWTWVNPAHWRTGINVRAKLTMLEFAFGDLGLRRVEFKTDAENERSRTAILALGSTFEGIFRKHMVRPGGGFRNSAYYSIIDDDWPAVRALLEARIKRHSPG